MFKKLAAEALGISDIGVIVGPADYSKVDADDYLFSEDGDRSSSSSRARRTSTASPTWP